MKQELGSFLVKDKTISLFKWSFNFFLESIEENITSSPQCKAATNKPGKYISIN